MTVVKNEFMVLLFVLTALLYANPRTPSAENELQRTFEVRVRGLGAFVLVDESGKEIADFAIERPSYGEFKNGIQHDEHRAISYAERVQLIREKAWNKFPEYTEYPHCVVDIVSQKAGMRFAFFLYPHFHNSAGLYDHEAVVQNMPYWQKIFKTDTEREYTFLFVPDELNDRTKIFLEGSFAGGFPGTERPENVIVKTGLELLSVKELFKRNTAFCELPALPHRSHELLGRNASLSVGMGEKIIEGIPITVWAPENSIDQGKHKKTTKLRDLVWDPILERTVFSIGPEYMHWAVEGKTWRYAWILCADIPQQEKEPVVGTVLAKFGRGCTNGNLDFQRTMLTEETLKSNPDIRNVGTLTYEKNGEMIITPLYLLRRRLNVAKLGARGMNSTSLDFEFTGGGTWEGYKRSSIQIFGCSLEEAPFSFDVKNPVRGNIFEKGQDVQRSRIEITAKRNNVSGMLVCSIFDYRHCPLEKKIYPFSLPKEGEHVLLDIDLGKYTEGWYGMTFSFQDSEGDVLFSHDASFTVLAPDDREAGYESPYACWPLLNGYHGSNPNPEEQLEVMRKAGYRKTWHPPCQSEEDGKMGKITRSSVGLGHLNPGWPAKTRAEFNARLDAAVAQFRKDFQAFPHCQIIQLLHEQGGGDIALEVRKGIPGVRGKYRGWDFETPGLSDTERGDWEVFFCTEYAKRMRKEFPGKKIMIGNGSSSSEKVASLIRRGFDLSLVDQLGIESKGFLTMPELNANREAPGMLWALRETGRAFGYTHFTMNACNEYVFRPERPDDVAEGRSIRELMRITDYTLRDYLISLAWGCSIISTGHLEDCNDAYYDTNWGASGQCTFYPFSYPKRMFTALAVLTRVFDSPEFLRRVPTGEGTSYALEFRRNRKKQDYAYALWTPLFDGVAELTFPEGTETKQIDWQGREDYLDQGRVIFGSTPVYILASHPVQSIRIIRHFQTNLTGMTFEKIGDFAEAPVKQLYGTSIFNSAWDMVPYQGDFTLTREEDSSVGGKVLCARLHSYEMDERYGHCGGGTTGGGPGSGGSGGGAGGNGGNGGAMIPSGPPGAGRECDITGEKLLYAIGGRGGSAGGTDLIGDGADGRDGFGDGGGGGNNRFGKGGKGGDGIVIFSLHGNVMKFPATGEDKLFTIPENGTLRILAVAGGGGGGGTHINYGSGGGGAGGMTETSIDVQAGETFLIRTGRGGQGGNINEKEFRRESNGEDTVIYRNGKEFIRMIGGGCAGRFGGSSGGMNANSNTSAPGAKLSKIAFASGGIQLEKPISVSYAPGQAIGIRFFGNSSFAKVKLVLRSKEGKSFPVSLVERDMICFHGWHLLVGYIPKELQNSGETFVIAEFWFGSAKEALAPCELTPVTDPVKVKDLFLVRLPETGENSENSSIPEKAMAADTMQFVDRKEF